MNKKEIIKELVKKTGCKHVEAEKFLAAFTETVTEELVRGGHVNLIGFGKFSTVKRAKRKGRNPQTNEELIIESRISPVFKAGKTLKRKVQFRDM